MHDAKDYDLVDKDGNKVEPQWALGDPDGVIEYADKMGLTIEEKSPRTDDYVSPWFYLAVIAIWVLGAFAFVGLVMLVAWWHPLVAAVVFGGGTIVVTVWLVWESCVAMSKVERRSGDERRD